MKDSKQTVQTIWFFISEEIQAGSACWQSDGFCYFGFWQCNHDRSPGKEKTINRKYYASELWQLNEAIKWKCYEKPRAGVLLFSDNMLVHIAWVAVAKTANCNFKLVPHPSYLASS